MAYSTYTYGDPYTPQGHLIRVISLVGPTPIPAGTSGPVPVPTDILGGVVDSSYTEVIYGIGGVPSYTFSLNSGTMPPGLSISSGGIISGTPTTIGTYTFVIRVIDSVGNIGLQGYTITISTPPSSGNYGYTS